jgi:hypothetical protein
VVGALTPNKPNVARLRSNRRTYDCEAHKTQDKAAVTGAQKKSQRLIVALVKAAALLERRSSVMTHSVIDVTNGPGKDDLLRAVTNAEALLTTIFDTSAGAVEAQINRIEERGDEGVDFTLWGQLASSSLSG